MNKKYRGEYDPTQHRLPKTEAVTQLKSQLSEMADFFGDSTEEGDALLNEIAARLPDQVDRESLYRVVKELADEARNKDGGNLIFNLEGASGRGEYCKKYTCVYL